MSFSALMDKLLGFELALAQLYRWFSNGFRHDPEVARVFGRLSLQEERHASVVRYQRRLANQNTSKFPPPDVDLEEIDRLLAEIDEFRTKHPKPKLSQAIAFAKNLETSAAERLHCSAVATANPELAAFVEKLAGDDEKHLGMLEELEARVTRKAS